MGWILESSVVWKNVTEFPQRLVGEKGLFEELALHNDEQFQKYEHGTLVVTDPHAFNAFKNHYPKLTGNDTNWPIIPSI
ncbi:MAG: hypothetical protein Ct9H300mP28_02650 [Pseudomonadota bacterium]|nr:MAG: hypothetical protein Ct9H300mP28_02650 [Pseudomonadota bacterium]